MSTKIAQNAFAIGDLASEFGVSTRTLRFYEEKGLLAPARQGGIRYFSPADRVRLRLILRGKRLGLSLQESAEIIDLYDAPTGSERQLRVLLERLGERRERLLDQARDIEASLADLDDVMAQCHTALESQ